MRVSLLLSCVLAAGLCSSPAAQADQIRTFTLSTDIVTPLYTLHPGGAITVDTTTGTVLSIDFVPSYPYGPTTYAGLQTYDGSSTSPYAELFEDRPVSSINITAGADIFLPTNNLINYSGGPICALEYACPETVNGTSQLVVSRAWQPHGLPLPINDGEFTLTSEVDQAATPEPSTLALLGTGMLGLLTAARRKPMA